MHDGAKVLRFHDAKAIYERRWKAVWERGDVDSVVELVDRALDAIEVARELKEDALRRQLGEARTQLRKAREQLDERGGQIRGMDTTDLNRAMHFGLISKAQHDVERKRRAEDFSVKEVLRSPSASGLIGGSAGGFLPCGFKGCGRLADLQGGSSMCVEHTVTVKPPRQYITGGMGVQNLDHQLELAEKTHADAQRRLDEAELQLAKVREKVTAFDAQPVG